MLRRIPVGGRVRWQTSVYAWETPSRKLLDAEHVVRYTTNVIESFADKRTKLIFAGELVKRLDPGLQTKVLRRLRYLDAAERLDDLRVPPSNRLEKKEGNLQDFYAIWVNTQWRIVFRWKDNSAYDVQLIDYHR